MELTLDQISAVYSIATKLLAVVLIILITPSIINQFQERRLLGIKFAMFTMATVTLVCLLPIIYYQFLHLTGHDNSKLLAVTTIANSTSLLTTAGAMYVIYKGGKN